MKTRPVTRGVAAALLHPDGPKEDGRRPECGTYLIGPAFIEQLRTGQPASGRGLSARQSAELCAALTCVADDFGMSPVELTDALERARRH